MSISTFIRGQVEGFKDRKARRRVESLARETESLSMEKKRMEEVSYYQNKRDEVARQVKEITPTKEESKLMRFGNNLARVINEQKKNPNLRRSVKPTLNKKAFNRATESGIFSGSKGFSIVGSAETNERYKPKNKSPFA
jgi:hypothetical protein